jgi:hypothetical protein
MPRRPRRSSSPHRPISPRSAGFLRAPSATRSAPPPAPAPAEKRNFILDFLVN